MYQKFIVVALLALIGPAGNGALSADEDDLSRQCMAEAENYGITDPEELTEFIAQCAADHSDSDSDVAPPNE